MTFRNVKPQDVLALERDTARAQNEELKKQLKVQAQQIEQLRAHAHQVQRALVACVHHAGGTLEVPHDSFFFANRGGFQFLETNDTENNRTTWQIKIEDGSDAAPPVPKLSPLRMMQ